VVSKLSLDLVGAYDSISINGSSISPGRKAYLHKLVGIRDDASLQPLRPDFRNHARMLRGKSPRIGHH
jgi:hypothetical protein